MDEATTSSTAAAASSDNNKKRPRGVDDGVDDDDDDGNNNKVLEEEGGTTMFKRLVRWIVEADGDGGADTDQGGGGGGYVHPDVEMIETTTDGSRRLRIRTTNSSATAPLLLPTGTVVFRIPRAVLLTASSREATASLSLLPRPKKERDGCDDECDSYCKDPSQQPFGSMNATTTKFSNSVQDLQLALYLCRAPERIRPYLDSLPSSWPSLSSSDDDEGEGDPDLPRNWPNSQLQNLLGGSPVLDHVLKLRRCIRDDYRRICDLFDDENKERQQQKQHHHLPTFSEFCRAMAVVSSRSFQGMEGLDDSAAVGKGGGGTKIPVQDNISLIPLLDLCNHRRGGGVSDNKKKNKNLSYRFDAAANCVVVEAVEDLHPGDDLYITYGAIGNAQLLVNFGFCLPDNLEPDGSANTVYRLRLRRCNNGGTEGEYDEKTEPAVPLRAGPKSYSYGGFVKAIECCFPTAQAKHKTKNSRDVGEDSANDRDAGADADADDDMEAFLNECEEEEEVEDGFDCWGDYNEDDEDEGANGEGEDDLSEYQSELLALESFLSELQRAREGYAFSDDKLRRALEAGVTPNNSREYYAALLVQSELRTIYFYAKAARQLRTTIREKLKMQCKEDSPSQLKLEVPPPGISPDDVALMDKQIEGLLDAYVQIRHSGL